MQKSLRLFLAAIAIVVVGAAIVLPSQQSLASDDCPDTAIWYQDSATTWDYKCPEEPPAPPPPPACPSGQEIIDGRCQTPQPLPPTPEPSCESKCVKSKPMGLTCLTELASRIDTIFDGEHQLLEGVHWSQVMNGVSMNLTVYDGHLQNSLLDVVLKNGEPLKVQMQSGLHLVVTNENGTLVQDGCYRITLENQGENINDGSIYFTQADAVKPENCPPEA